SADGPAVPERGQRAVLRPVRGLHPREVPPPLAAGGGRARGQDVRRLLPRRRLGPTALGHGNGPKPAAPVIDPPVSRRLDLTSGLPLVTGACGGVGSG